MIESDFPSFGWISVAEPKKYHVLEESTPPGSMSQAPFFSKTNCPQDVHRTKGTACPEVFPESSNLYNYVEIICLALCCILFQQSLAELLLCIDLRDWGCAGTVKSRTYVK
jgi:hypothetical protein